METPRKDKEKQGKTNAKLRKTKKTHDKNKENKGKVRKSMENKRKQGPWASKNVCLSASQNVLHFACSL